MEIDLLLGWDCDSSRLWRSKTSVLYPISTGKSWSSLGFCIFLVIQGSVKPAPCPVMLRSCSSQARKGIETERGSALLGNPPEGSTQPPAGTQHPQRSACPSGAAGHPSASSLQQGPLAPGRPCSAPCPCRAIPWVLHSTTTHLCCTQHCATLCLTVCCLSTTR